MIPSGKPIARPLLELKPLDTSLARRKDPFIFSAGPREEFKNVEKCIKQIKNIDPPPPLLQISDKDGKLTITPLDVNKSFFCLKITLFYSFIKVYEFDETDLNEISEIGHGEFGSVYKVIHKPTNTLMALKVRGMRGKEDFKLILFFFNRKFVQMLTKKNSVN